MSDPLHRVLLGRVRYRPRGQRAREPENQKVSSLQDLCMTALIKWIKSSDLNHSLSMLESMAPSKIQCDVVIKLDQIGRSVPWIKRLLSSPEFVLSALSVKDKRSQMFVAFQKPIVIYGSKFISALTKSVNDKLKKNPGEATKHFNGVAALASILLDLSRPHIAEAVLANLLACSVGTDDLEVVAAKLLLLNALTTQLKLAEAGDLAGKLAVLKVFNDDSLDVKSMELRASFNMECSRFYLTKSAFGLAYFTAMTAVSCLREEHPPRLVVDVYRAASRACILGSKLDMAKVFVREAFLQARGELGPKDFACAEAMVDLGFYWQSIGDRWNASGAYREALEVFRHTFISVEYQFVGIFELAAQIDLDAYTNDLKSLYSLIAFDELEEDVVFEDARVMLKWDDVCSHRRSILGSDQRPLAANGERMDAIFTIKRRHEGACRQLELFWRQGSALDPEEFEDFNDIKDRLRVSLAIAKKTFGEKSLQTARHLDSLGFFYRKTLQLSSAMSTLQHALAAKEAVLDADDPEVANTLRQLAVVHCLRREFDRAAQLFLRCISIMRKVDDGSKPPVWDRWPFADCLVRDYRFLIMCYKKTGNAGAMLEWTERYRERMALANNVQQPEDPLNVGASQPQSLADVVEELKRLGAFL